MANYVTKLKAGDKAPDFKGKDQQGNIISLKDYTGKKLVLFFYPKDNTAGCINEVCNLRDNYSALEKAGYSIVGVSADDEKKHKKFIDKFKLPFPLIADVDKKIIEAYDVWGEKKFMGLIFDGIVRTTFVIDEKGIIEQVITTVDTKNHTQQILEMKNERIKN
ncbi:MAG: thioredoxin-dependent thiol peroxidase [Bacteroidetes bacterium]|nr:thioredoxin-dependent thiol peroxidase [Bacteroidota bacterium]